MRGNSVKPLIVWDFAGTLAYREGGEWGATLLELLRRRTGDHALTPNDTRPHLQHGFPWSSPSLTHPHRTADDWWNALFPVLASCVSRVAPVSLDVAWSIARDAREHYEIPRRGDSIRKPVVCCKAFAKRASAASFFRTLPPSFITSSMRSAFVTSSTISCAPLRPVLRSRTQRRFALPCSERVRRRRRGWWAIASRATSRALREPGSDPFGFGARVRSRFRTVDKASNTLRRRVATCPESCRPSGFWAETRDRCSHATEHSAAREGRLGGRGRGAGARAGARAGAGAGAGARARGEGEGGNRFAGAFPGQPPRQAPRAAPSRPDPSVNETRAQRLTGRA